MIDLLIIAGILFLFYSVSLWSAGQEGFENSEQVDPYDELYASI